MENPKLSDSTAVVPVEPAPTGAPATPGGYARFTTSLQVRPDDIDMNQHVHASRYLDYVLAARYDQMRRCYGMAMEEFLAAGYAWVVRRTRLEYRRALKLGETFHVRTGVQEILRDSVRVQFEILRAANGKLCCEGDVHYTLINRATGRAQALPDPIKAIYSI